MDYDQESIMDNLSCPICLEIFKDPRNLSCSHTFCCDCLLELIKN